MITELSEEEMAALVLLKRTGVPMLEAAQVACAAIKSGKGRTKRALRCIAAGAEELKKQERTVSFEKAVEEALEVRRERRARTVYDFRYFCKRFMKLCPGLARRKVRAISAQECARYIDMAFDTPRQQQKARLILSGVFGTAVKRGWCSENPVARVESPRVVEKHVPILTPQEIKDLRQTAASYRNGSCAPALGMMLYAGIRPHEVARLNWAQVALRERAIYIQPQHSKTGGARRVTIHKPLLQIMHKYKRADSEKICPPNWLRHWRELRRAAGWDTPDHLWSQDALRHTFASYHLSHFRSYVKLQVEIGHRDATLLRTRYVDQRGVVNARAFWSNGMSQ